MANEYLQRRPTSTGNRQVWTWSGWIKRNILDTQMQLFGGYGAGGGQGIITFSSGNLIQVREYSLEASAETYNFLTTNIFRDVGNWMHILVSYDTTQDIGAERIQIYVNGDLQQTTQTTTPTKNLNQNNINLVTGSTGDPKTMAIGRVNVTTTTGQQYELADYFFIDGQALTPDVFGFYKQGKGYISVGSTQATDFRPGQWVPKTPRVIKTEINRRGGFGVNGFYLPMNDSKNFGADFHCDPNSIITLNEKLPQPRVGVASTATVGLGFTDVLRADPYASNLVLALPFVSSGLCTNGTNVGVNTGFGDYSAVIKGSGSPKVGIITASSLLSIANTAGYYGSAGSFNGSNSQLTIPSSTDFQLSDGDFTIELWANPNTIKDGNTILSLGTGGNSLYWVLGVGRIFGGITFGSGNGAWNFTTSPVSGIGTSRANQWTHVAVVRKGSILTYYQDGVAVGISTNHNFGSGNGGNLYIGSYFQNYNGDGSWFDGYIQDLRIYKGVAKYTTGFDVPKPYTPVGIATWRAVPDTTANNFATLNALIPAGGVTRTYTNGNLDVSVAGLNTNTYSTIGVGTTGKWYWEFQIPTIGGGANPMGGIAAPQFCAQEANLNRAVVYRVNGNTIVDDTQSSYGATYTTTDIIGVAVNVTDSQVTFYKNGTSQGAINYSGISTTAFLPVVRSNAGTDAFRLNFGQNPTFSGNVSIGTFTDTNGKGLFKYQPPSGFLALCEDNLPTPAISDPGKYFKTVLYTGDGTDGRNIVGVGFTPDLVWVKARNQAYNNGLFDSVRGSRGTLYSNLTNAEEISGPYSFNADGFSQSSTWNNSSTDFVAWCWRAGAGTTSTNTNGSITSVVSVNQDAGFSIATYTGTGSALTFGHGLGKVPAFAIFKYRSGPSGGWAWVVYHKSLPTNYYVYLQSTVAQQNLTGVFTTAPTSTLFSLGTEGAVNTNNNNMLCYSWAEIEGFSKFGSYVGNGNADGPFVYCGFKPALVIAKLISSSDNWRMYDNARSAGNPTNLVLYPNLTNVEGYVTDHIDYLSNGFKWRSNNNNSTGSTYIFAAWAESPFTTANAK